MTKPADILKGGQRIIEAGIKEELRDQGHYLTGALERSIQAVINGETMEGQSLDYLLKLDEGIPANEIQINSDTLAQMTRYVELRFGYRGGKAQKLALRILQKQAVEGNPTIGSRAYSKTGERKKALHIGFTNAEPKLDNYMSSGIDRMMNESFNQIKSETV